MSRLFGIALVIAQVIALAQSPALAEVQPVAGAGDPRIQTVTYDPQQVVTLHTQSGLALTVQLSPEERVESVAIGAGDRWSVQPTRRGDQIVIKPNAADGIDTDMIVTTDARTYLFRLAGTSDLALPVPFLVSFVYPRSAVAREDAERAPLRRYRLFGSRDLWPDRISDDGIATTIHWPSDMPIPAVYAKGRNGARSLLNGTMRDGSFVISSIEERLEFVLDGRIASARREVAEKGR